jgi:hypothetical protein
MMSFATCMVMEHTIYTQILSALKKESVKRQQQAVLLRLPMATDDRHYDASCNTRAHERFYNSFTINGHFGYNNFFSSILVPRGDFIM